MAAKIYWTTTGLLAVAMAGAGIMDLLKTPEVVEAFTALGLPTYMLAIVGVAKLVGAPLLLVPAWPRLREWVYAGFAIDFLGAAACHLAVGQSVREVLPAFGATALLAVSYATYRIARAPKLA